jgi:hypothetical protein
MRMPGCAALSLFLLLFGASVAAGQDQKNDTSAASATPPSEVRLHYKVISPTGVDDYVATQISVNSEKLDRTRTIVENAQGKRFLLTHETDYVKQTTSNEIREVGGHEFLRMKFSSLWTAITRSGTIEEAEKHPELLKRTDLPFEFGFECSDKQKARAEKALAAKPPSTKYY